MIVGRDDDDDDRRDDGSFKNQRRTRNGVSGLFKKSNQFRNFLPHSNSVFVQLTAGRIAIPHCGKNSQNSWIKCESRPQCETSLVQVPQSAGQVYTFWHPGTPTPSSFFFRDIQKSVWVKNFTKIPLRYADTHEIQKYSVLQLELEKNAHRVFIR